MPTLPWFGAHRGAGAVATAEATGMVETITAELQGLFAPKTRRGRTILALAIRLLPTLGVG